MSSSTFHFGPKKSWPFPGTTAAGEHLFGASPKSLNNLVNINNTATNPKWFGTMPQMKYTISLIFSAYYGASGYTNVILNANQINFNGNGICNVRRYDSTFSSQIGSTWYPSFGTYTLGNIAELNPTGYTAVGFGTNTIIEYYMLFQNGNNIISSLQTWTYGLAIYPNASGWSAYQIANQINSNTVTCDQINLHLQSYVFGAGATNTIYLTYSVYDF